jgi:hypothetical protein
LVYIVWPQNEHAKPSTEYDNPTFGRLNIFRTPYISNKIHVGIEIKRVLNQSSDQSQLEVPMPQNNQL